MHELDIGAGVVLHYVEQGNGPALVLVHGSLSDYSYWQNQLPALAAHYHVVAYSRRYNVPNHNRAIAGYSALTDSEDLAALITTLQLGKVYLIGHSYGALTALFLSAQHPELVRAVVLAEPPAMNLLLSTPAPAAEQGSKMYADVQARMVEPMQRAFRSGHSERGVATFINYVFDDPHAWGRMNADDRAETLRSVREWQVMLPAGVLFPPIAPDTVKGIQVPVLMMSGGRSYRFLKLIDAALLALLPDCRQVVFADAGHQMWLQHPEEARRDAENFFLAH